MMTKLHIHIKTDRKYKKMEELIPHYTPRAHCLQYPEKCLQTENFYLLSFLLFLKGHREKKITFLNSGKSWSCST